MTNTYANDLRASVATRREYETVKSASCDSMLAALKAFDKRLANDAVVALCESANLDANTLNRQERNNARFNIYAFAKVLDDVSVATMNHYTLAILRAAIALKKNELTLTHADAVAACSLSVTHKDKSRAKIIAASRYAKHVAANTASTQSSSSVNSLCALNVLTESRDASNHVCYSVAQNAFADALIAQI
jgi:hypothetical protein